MPNLENLKPFEKGHKKLGGRKKGVPNKSSLDPQKLILAAAEKVGSDGRGTGGVMGFFVSIMNDHPMHAVRLASAILNIEAKEIDAKRAAKEAVEKALQTILADGKREDNFLCDLGKSYSCILTKLRKMMVPLSGHES